MTVAVAFGMPLQMIALSS